MRAYVVAFVTLLAALAAAPAWVGGAAALAQDAPADRVRAALPAEAAAEFEAILAEARARDLPEEPLVNKALQGIGRNIPPARILEVVREDLAHLDRSRGILDGVPHTATDLVAVSDAIRQGLPETALRNLARGARQDESVAIAVHTLGDLMERGVPVEHALELLEAWRARGRPAAELREVPAAVERLIRQGTLPAAAAEAVTAQLRGGRGRGAGPPGQRP